MPNRYERTHGYDVMRLQEGIRDQVLEKHREWQVEHEWWDFVYEDAKRMGALMGIEIDEIQFSGFWSQGDGASFTGEYRCKPDAVEAVTRECNGTDQELIRIATELTRLQVTWKLRHGFTWECSIKRYDHVHHHSAHSGIMVTSWSDDQDEYQTAGSAACNEMDKEVERFMRDFANWIYKQLEAEHEDLTCEDTVIECIRSSGLRFTSAGQTI